MASSQMGLAFDAPLNEDAHDRLLRVRDYFFVEWFLDEPPTLPLF
jgi:hypothetical protein